MPPDPRSVVFGELAPKSVVIARAEGTALFVAPFMRFFYYLGLASWSSTGRPATRWCASSKASICSKNAHVEDKCTVRIKGLIRCPTPPFHLSPRMSGHRMHDLRLSRTPGPMCCAGPWSYRGVETPCTRNVVSTLREVGLHFCRYFVPNFSDNDPDRRHHTDRYSPSPLYEMSSSIWMCTPGTIPSIEAPR